MVCERPLRGFSNGSFPGTSLTVHSVQSSLTSKPLHFVSLIFWPIARVKNLNKKFPFSRADCFGTKFYYGCMEVLLVEEDLKKQVSSILEEAHSGYYDPLSKK